MAYESLRWWDNPGGKGVMCNKCIHYHNDGTCKAFSKGIPWELIYRGEHDTPFPNDQGIRYEAIKE